MQPTELYQAQLAGGGVPTEKSGEQKTSDGQPPFSHFGDPYAEYLACAEGAALFDLSGRTQINMSGGDRQKFLHNFCTNDINRLSAGDGCEALVTDMKGHVLAHILVFASDNILAIESTAGAAEVLLPHFDHFIINEDVQFDDQADVLGELFVTGPMAVENLTNMDSRVGDLPEFGHHAIDVSGQMVTVRRVDFFRRSGFLCSAPSITLAEMWRKLVGTKVVSAGAQAFHARRIESGFPLHGIDISENNLAQEAARTSRAISFTKNCYLGQEPIARIDAVGHVNRELRAIESNDPVVVGATILSEEGREIGTISSSAIIPGEKRWVALGMLHRTHTAPASRVLIESGDETVPATVFWPE